MCPLKDGPGIPRDPQILPIFSNLLEFEAMFFAATLFLDKMSRFTFFCTLVVEFKSVPGLEGVGWARLIFAKIICYSQGTVECLFQNDIDLNSDMKISICSLGVEI